MIATIKTIVSDNRIGGKFPVDLPVEADNRYMTIRLNDYDLQLPIEDVMTVLTGDDGK